jgi:hypothetical protein
MKWEQVQIRTFQRSHLIERFGGIEAQKLSELAAVLRVFVNTKLDVLSERLIEFVEVVLVF